MQTRLDLVQANPAAYRAIMQLERYVRSSGVDSTILELIKIRVSQINGCAFCIDMHTKDARLNGETEQRIYALSAWHETPFFTAQERAILALTEAVTLIASSPVSDAIYADVNRYFAPNEIIDLLMAIVTINSWNRIAITAQTLPGSYEPKPVEAAV
ncbi:MAG: carboxymuconolactone decarboxylase family protein [Kaiparowitsia implicata GSE-PSE-MK54-09C]|jgi:AhpD family alkylhydroperoxidase|nr:carboxymuconolactone decarboxylase family protein [Kaiparowitsia implicata GSE-PSE-MK54-09C]